MSDGNGRNGVRVYTRPVVIGIISLLASGALIQFGLNSKATWQGGRYTSEDGLRDKADNRDHADAGNDVVRKECRSRETEIDDKLDGIAKGVNDLRVDVARLEAKWDQRVLAGDPITGITKPFVRYRPDLKWNDYHELRLRESKK